MQPSSTMLNRSCERCRVKKLRCPGGKVCEICLAADATCIYEQRKKKVMRKKRLIQPTTTPLNNLLSNNSTQSTSGRVFSDEISRDVFDHSDSTPSSSTHQPSLTSSATSISATSHLHTSSPSTDLNQSKSLNPGEYTSGFPQFFLLTRTYTRFLSTQDCIRTI